MSSKNAQALEPLDPTNRAAALQSRSQPVAAAAQPAPANWTWDANGGYWIVK